MDAIDKKKKPYDAAYRRAQYEKHRATILAHQKEYDAAHKEQRRIAACNRYRIAHGLPVVKTHKNCRHYSGEFVLAIDGKGYDDPCLRCYNFDKWEAKK